MKPRELTTDEVQDRFLDHVANIVDSWEKESRAETVREKLEGVAFSILVAIDGCAMALPAFILAPLPHSEDKQFCIDEGEEFYFPENHAVTPKIKANITGGLHELIHQHYRRK